MKKFLAIAGAIIIGASSLHAADIELDVLHFWENYNRVSHTTLDGSKLPQGTKISTRYNSPVLGLGLNANFYLAEKGIAKLGVSVVGGFDFGTLLSIGVNSSVFPSNATWGGGGFLKVGFASSINFNDIHSLYISPGVIMTGASGSMKILGTDNRISTFLVGLDIDIGYRAFFLHKSTFDFGIDVGLNIDFPLGGLVTSKDSAINKTFKSGAFGGGFKIYAGPAFRLK